MLGLVHITNVVDEQAKAEGALVGLVWQTLCDGCEIGRLASANFPFEEGSHVNHSADDVGVRLLEVEVLKGRALLVEVRQVDVVPVALERVALPLNVVGKSGALSERVGPLCDDRAVCGLQCPQFIEGCGQDGRVLLFQNGLGPSRN